MMAHTNPASSSRPGRLLTVFAGVFGAFLGLSLLKFGNPPIMEKWVTRPGDIYEFVLGYPWPIEWAYWLLAAICLFGFATGRWQIPGRRWLIILPAAWFAWQLLAATQTLDTVLSRLTVMHFGACIGCFYLGHFCLAPANRSWFWRGIFVAFLVVLAIGFEQHFGGLEETRRYFFLYLYPKLAQFPPDYMKKMTSNRIFATLFYPNALAGALLLLLPAVLAAVMETRLLTLAARSFLAGLIATAAMCCLYWSASKAGWLLMLLLAIVCLFHFRLDRRIKLAVFLALVLGGTVGFAVKYSSFFRRGATSVVARFDYWSAAARTAATHPIWGTGPGTFAIPYERMKRPESEMSRLVHNDYLEQASDSGLVGSALYTTWIGLVLWTTRPKSIEDLLYFATWLGFLGWSLQGLVEFGLYIPALAWPSFTFMGLLLGTRPQAANSVDKSEPATVGSVRR